MKYCEHCGEGVYVDKIFGFYLYGNKFCNNCGNSTKKTIKLACSNNHRVSMYDNNCGECGESLKVKFNKIRQLKDAWKQEANK